MGDSKRLCVSATVCHKFSKRKEGQAGFLDSRV